jgi:hypothetical protein
MTSILKEQLFFLCNHSDQVCEPDFIALMSTVYDQRSGEHGGLHESLREDKIKTDRV